MAVGKSPVKKGLEENQERSYGCASRPYFLDLDDDFDFGGEFDFGGFGGVLGLLPLPSGDALFGGLSPFLGSLDPVCARYRSMFAVECRCESFGMKTRREIIKLEKANS